MLAHRLRRWPNIEAALGECPMFAGSNNNNKNNKNNKNIKNIKNNKNNNYGKWLIDLNNIRSFPHQKRGGKCWSNAHNAPTGSDIYSLMNERSPTLWNFVLV